MNKSKYLRVFHVEPDDNAGSLDMLEPESETLGQEPDASVDPVEPEAPAAPTLPMTADDIAAAVRAAMPQPVASVAAKPQMTQAEVNKLLKKFEVDDAFVEKFDNLSTKKQALQELLDRAADHAEARAQVHTYGEVSRVEQTFAPRLAAFEQFQAEQREARFNSRYPELANAALRPLIGAVAQQVLYTQKFADEQSAFEAVAKGAERLIQTTAPTFKLKASAKTTANPNELPTVSSGSGGGGGQAAPVSRKGPPGIDLFTSLR